MSGNDGKLWDFLAQCVEDYVKDKATISEYRELYAERLAENRWANKNFNGIVDTIFESLDNLEREYMRKGDRDEDWMNEGVAALVDGHFANSVLSDRRASDALTDREYDQMQGAVEQFKRLTGAGGRRTSSRSEERDNGRGRNDRSTGRDLGRAATSGHRNGRDTGGKAVSGDHWSALLNVGEDEPEPQRERDRTPPERYVAPHPIEVAQATVERETARPAVEGPDYTKARPWDRFYRGGELWELAHKTKLKLTGDGSFESTIPTLYDCTTSIKYFVMDTEGNVREELEPVNDENRYAAHETLNRSEDQPVAAKPQSAGFSRATLEAGKTDDDLAAKYRVANSRVRLVDLIDEIKEDQLTLSDSAAGDHLTSAIFGSRAKLRASGDNARVDLHLLRTPIVATGFEQIELIEQVYNTSSLAGAQQKPVELKSQFDLPVWETLNQRYSNFLLRALTYQFQYNEIVKFNFAKHYQKLLDTLTNDRGAEFAAQFAERVGYITDLACGHFGRSDVGAYTADLFEPSEGAELPVVAFVDFISISAFNCTLDQLGIGNQLESSETGLVVNQAQHRDLNVALRKLYQNLDKALPAPAKIRVYLSTSDNRLVEVLPYANRMDTFILAAV